MKLEEALREQAKPKRTEARGSSPGRCSCGAEFTSESAWEKHADAEGHHRFELDLP